MKSAKIQPLAALERLRADLRKQGKTVVFTNGCFDLVHAGHIRLFEKAKACGDVLIVALNSDSSVRKIKGPTRPLFPLSERFEVLAAIEAIDYLTSFSEETPRKIIAALLPDVLVKGGDWGAGEIVGRTEVEAAGGKVVRVPYLRGHSSTNLIEKMLENCRKQRQIGSPGRRRGGGRAKK
jgi:D-beta-D-heptose 7-phosphate kinase/D-beta-D-heptose 1-phosphate adenosyltransferase